MKIIPLTFFVLILTLASCDKNKILKQENQNSEEIISLLDRANQEELSFYEKEVFLNKAVNLSKNNGNDSLWLQALSLKVYYSSHNSQNKTAQYILELEKISKEKNIAKFIGYANLMKGDMYQQQSMYDSAYNSLKESNKYYFQIKDSLKIGYNLIKMAQIHQFYNDYYSSEELATEALKFLENTNNRDYILEAYNILGHSYLNTKNYEQAIDFYRKSLKFIENPKGQIIIKNNIASTYIYLKEYDKALDILIQLLNEANSKEYLSEKALVLYNIGSAKFHLDKNDGLQELEESLDIRLYVGNEIGAIENYIKLAEFYKDKDKKLIKKYLLEALKKAEKYNNIDNYLKSLKILIRLSDKDKLKKYSQEYIHLNDSIMEVRQKAKNQFAKIRFDYSKELEQNLLLKNKTVEDELIIQRQKNTNQLLFFGILLTGILGVYFYSVIRNRHKREKRKEVYKTENRIAVRIHDELANDVYNVMAYTENSDLSVEENRLKLLDNLEDVYNRTRNISKENSTVDTGARYVEALKNMLSEYKKNELKIIMAGIDDIDWTVMDSHKKIIIYRVLQELMVNMKKHSGASVVMVRFENKNKQFHIHYSDNGVGFSDEKIIFKNGFQNVENRIKTINGTIIFDPKTGKGLKILITFPL